MSVTSVPELQAAWQAVTDGQFRRPPGEQHRTASPSRMPDAGDSDARIDWRPSAPVLPVIGCHSAAGASTVTAAVAAAFAGPVHVLEACGAGASGMVGYATVELGETGSGWVRGNRDHVVIDRVAAGALTPADIPLPEPAEDVALHILDPGWDLGVLALSHGWLRAAVLEADCLVLVTTATVPGMRRLEGALFELEPDQQRLVVAVRGPKSRRWPREIRGCLGARARAVLDSALVEVPEDPGLHVRGLDTAPLPSGVLAAAAQILQLTGLATETNHQKGTTHVRQ